MTTFSPHFSAERTILDDLAAVASRRKGVILATTIAAILSVYLTLLFLPESYEATALLEVMIGRENTEVPAGVQKGNIYPSGIQKEEINSYIQLLKARESAENVVETMGLQAFRFESPPPQTLLQHVKSALRNAKTWAMDTLTDALIALSIKKELTEREKVIQLLNSSLDANREGDSNVIRASLHLPSREIAVEALAAVIKSSLDRNPHSQTASSVLPILEAQVGEDERGLQALQQRRLQIMNEGGLSSVERDRAELLQRLHRVLYEMDDKKSQLATASARLDELTTNPIRLSARDEINQTDVQIAGLRAGIQQDEANARTINTTLDRLNTAAVSLESVTLRIGEAEKRFAIDTAQRDEAHMNQMLDEARVHNVAMMSAAAAGPEPVSPNKLRFLGFGAAGGLILGIVLAILLEWGDDRIRGRDQLSRLSGLPVLGEFQLNPARDPDVIAATTQSRKKSSRAPARA